MRIFRADARSCSGLSMPKLSIVSLLWLPFACTRANLPAKEPNLFEPPGVVTEPCNNTCKPCFQQAPREPEGQPGKLGQHLSGIGKAPGTRCRCDFHGRNSLLLVLLVGGLAGAAFEQKPHANCDAVLALLPSVHTSVHRFMCDTLTKKAGQYFAYEIRRNRTCSLAIERRRC